MTTVQALFRYPVKSMQGLPVEQVEVGAAGIAGDRTWALVDLERGTLLSAKRHSALLQAAADDERITLPDGATVELSSGSSADADRVLSDWLGRPVELRTAGGGESLSYEMTFEPPNDHAEYVPIPSPAGSFLDLAGVHLLSTATLDAGRHAYPDLDWDVRRFRPNVVVDGSELEPFGEDAWTGRQVRVGGAVLAATQPTVRCAMPLRAQPGLERQRDLYDALEDLHRNHLGLYLDIVEPGPVSVGDPVTLA